MGKICKLEDDLINTEVWQKYYDEMPKKCKSVVDSKIPEGLGIGRNEKYGWFIMGSGQGPSLLWSEKEVG